MAIESHIDTVIKVYYTEEAAIAGGTANMLPMDTATGAVSRTQSPSSNAAGFNYFIYREYWYRVEFNEPVREFYIDWDDGENNDPTERANYQIVKFDTPRFFGVVSHIYTKNTKFFPLIKVKSLDGFWSKYYTSDDVDNDYNALESATLTGGQNDFSIVSEVPADSNSKKLMPYFTPHNLPPTGILKVDRKRIFSGIDNDLIDSSVTNGNVLICFCDNANKNLVTGQITLDIVYQDNSGQVKNTIISSYDHRSSGITVKRLLAVKLQNLKETTASTGTQLKSTERVYIRRKSDNAVIACASLGNPYITFDGVGYSALLDASESITKASNVDIKISGDGGHYWDTGKSDFGIEVTNANPINVTDEFTNDTVSTDTQKRVRYMLEGYKNTDTSLDGYKDSFGRFFTEERLCRVQVEDDHTDNSPPLFHEDTFAKSPIETFRRDSYTLEKYIPSDYVNEGLILAYYHEGETSSLTNVWTDKSVVLTDATSFITLGRESGSTIANGPHQHILLVRERKFNKIFISVQNLAEAIDGGDGDAGAVSYKIRLNLRYVAKEGSNRVWKPLAFVDNTSIGDDLSLRKSGTLVFDMPEDWVLAQGDADSSGIWDSSTWDSAPPRADSTSVDPDTLWDFDGYGLMIDIAVEGANFDTTGNIKYILPFDNTHSQVIEIEDPHHVSLSNIAMAQSISWKRQGKYYSVEDRLGRAEIRKIGVEGAGNIRIGGIELNNDSDGSASYKKIQNYQEKSVPVFVDVEREGGEFIRFFGKVVAMSEDKPTGKMKPKWGADIAVSHIIEFDSSGVWVSDTPVGLGGYIEDEPRYIPTTVQL
jgi:hypothetical protein|tara:strand:+ start:4793 stop:7255 length:2463 start_codon:yes stop_codon:yes gene_type:complete